MTVPLLSSDGKAVKPGQLIRLKVHLISRHFQARHRTTGKHEAPLLFSRNNLFVGIPNSRYMILKFFFLSFTSVD